MYFKHLYKKNLKKVIDGATEYYPAFQCSLFYILLKLQYPKGGQPDKISEQTLAKFHTSLFIVIAIFDSLNYSGDWYNQVPAFLGKFVVNYDAISSSKSLVNPPNPKSIILRIPS